MEQQRHVQISKTMSKALRHKPESLGLKPTISGWVGVETLLAALNQKGFAITRTELEEVVAKNDKQRFSFDQNKENIRANQGHSIEIDLELNPLEPPAFLFHGTTSQALESVLASGLQRMKRHHVHLSPDTQTALRVGNRHGKAVLLRIKALEMHQEGYEFFCSENGVWLVDEVPPRFLEVMNSACSR